ncbi:sigma factor, partial [Nocardioides sp.]|uniref:sigma factor n=1 Tax=Nocardioides sp. TaxID=35761 RepID=UPI002F3F09DE
MATAEDNFTVFYDATWSRTVACAYAVTGDLGAAEEAAQEAYTRAWPRWATLAAYDDPGAWVRRVAWNLATSRWRRLRRAQAYARTLREPQVDGPGPD